MTPTDFFDYVGKSAIVNGRPLLLLGMSCERSINGAWLMETQFMCDDGKSDLPPSLKHRMDEQFRVPEFPIHLLRAARPTIEELTGSAI